MARRKKHPRLPNGWGSIRYLGKGRRNPYAVHPPAKDQSEKTGHYIQPKALCYVDDYNVGLMVLASYRAGTYKPGDETLFSSKAAEGDMDALLKRLIADGALVGAAKNATGPTLKDVYNNWYEWKTGDGAAVKVSKSAIDGYKLGFQHLEPLHDRLFSSLTVDEMQAVINADKGGNACIRKIKSLLTMLFKYGESRGLCEKNLAAYLVVPAAAAKSEHGIPYTLEDIRYFWDHREDEFLEMALITCYTGHRKTEYKDAFIDLENGVIKGGIKTDAGKNRIVPIHSAILPIIRGRIERYGDIYPKCTLNHYTSSFSDHLEKLKIMPDKGGRHTFHDGRHTFSALCEKYGVPENDRKRLLGHSFTDVTNGVYGHRDIEDLRRSIELIPPPWNL